MFASKLQTIRLLNGLRLIHTERINGYNKALSLMNMHTEAALQNVNLHLLLSNFVRDSIFFSATLDNIVLIEGGKMPYGVKVDQQLFKITRQLNSLFNEMDSHSILSCCNACENIIHEAYNSMLQQSGLATDPKVIIANQHKELKKAQQLVNSLQYELGKQPSQSNKAVVVELYNAPNEFVPAAAKMSL